MTPDSPPVGAPDPEGARADPARDEDLVREFAQHVLETAAPEELVLFDETAGDYFRDPGAVLDPARRDEAVGFGLDLALLTPYVLAVAAPVLSFLGQTVLAAVKEEATPVLTDLVRRLFRRSPTGDRVAQHAAPAALSPAQADRVRDIALARAADLGLPPDQARLLADSVVGGLVTASD